MTQFSFRDLYPTYTQTDSTSDTVKPEAEEQAALSTAEEVAITGKAKSVFSWAGIIIVLLILFAMGAIKI